MGFLSQRAAPGASHAYQGLGPPEAARQVSGEVTDNRTKGENDGISRLGESEKGTGRQMWGEYGQPLLKTRKPARLLHSTSQKHSPGPSRHRRHVLTNARRDLINNQHAHGAFMESRHGLSP